MLLKKSRKSSIIGEKEIVDLSLLIVFSVFLFIFSNINTYPLEVSYAKFISNFIGSQHGNVIIYNNSAFQINKLCLGFVSISFLIFLFLIDRKVNVYLLISILVLFLLNLIRITTSIYLNNILYHQIFTYSMVVFSLILWFFFRRF